MPAKSHGESQTKLYRKWLLMKRACNNPHAKNYKNVGGQGARVDPEWETDYLKFKDYALAHGYKDGLVIDRKDKKKNFEPGNVIFVTRQQRQQNKVVKYSITYRGRTQSIRQWADDIGISRQALHVRIQNASSPQKAIEEAFISNKRKHS